MLISTMVSCSKDGRVVFLRLTMWNVGELDVRVSVAA